MTFDTLTAARCLEQAGMDPAHAEAVTDAIRVAVSGRRDEGRPGRSRTPAHVAHPGRRGRAARGRRRQAPLHRALRSPAPPFREGPQGITGRSGVENRRPQGVVPPKERQDRSPSKHYRALDVTVNRPGRLRHVVALARLFGGIIALAGLVVATIRLLP